MTRLKPFARQAPPTENVFLTSGVCVAAPVIFFGMDPSAGGTARTRDQAPW